MEITTETVVRAWKDEQFRNGLPSEVQEAVPEKPVGRGGNALTDEQLEAAAGGILPVVAGIAAGVGGLAASAAVGYAISDAVDGKC